MSKPGEAQPPTLQRQFLSFIEFPKDGDLPDSPIRNHHHFGADADDGNYVEPDSLPWYLVWGEFDDLA